jgi:hypothetical protein
MPHLSASTNVGFLRYSGLWEGPIRTLANPRGPPVALGRASDEPRELQLVLDPEFL